MNYFGITDKAGYGIKRTLTSAWRKMSAFLGQNFKGLTNEYERCLSIKCVFREEHAQDIRDSEVMDLHHEGLWKKSHQRRSKKRQKNQNVTLRTCGKLQKFVEKHTPNQAIVTRARLWINLKIMQCHISEKSSK